MMNKLLLSCIALLFFAQANTQQLLWNSQFTGTGDNIPVKSVIDMDGNIYVVGNFTGDVTYGDSSFTTYGDRDIFVSKTDKNGELVWIHQIGSTLNFDFATGISLNSDGSKLFVAGQYLGTLNLIDRQISSALFDGYVVCFNADGTIDYIKNVASGSTHQFISDIKVDKDDSLIISGTYKDTIVLDATKGIGLSADPYTDAAFIAKYDMNGNCSWAKSYNGAIGAPNFYSLDVSSDAYYFGGYYEGLVNIDTFTLNAPTFDMFLYKTDLHGNSKWLRHIRGNADDFGYSTIVDEDENIYFNGYYNSTTGLYVDSTQTDSSVKVFGNQGNSDIILTKYNSDGQLLWSDAVGSSGTDVLYDSYHRNGNFIVAGSFGGQLEYGQETIEPVGGTDVFGLIFDSYDDLIYILDPGGSGNDVGKTCVIDSIGNFYITGNFDSPQIYFDQYDTLDNDVAGKDMFISKYNKMSVDIFVTDALCNGADNGSIFAVPRGIGESPFTYEWSNGKSTSIITDLAVGWHSVTLTDNTGYTVVDSAYIDEPPALIASVITNTDASCSGSGDGVIELDVSGGTIPYSYLWTTTGGSGIVQGNEDQLTLNSGAYNVTVSDDNGCKQIISGTIVDELESMILTANIDTSTTGTNGAIDLSVSGGTSPYYYIWAKDGDAGFDSTTQDVTGLSGGEHYVTVTDDNGCNKDSSFIVVESGKWFLSSLENEPFCNGGNDGNIILNFAGDTTGASPITFVWTKDGDAGFDSTTQVITQLTAGTYHVTATDGFTNSDEKTIILSEPGGIIITPTVTDILCNGDSTGLIDIEISGGASPYSYTWSRIGDGTFASSDQDIFNLDTGTYTVTVTDNNNCSNTNQSVIDEPTNPLGATPTITNVCCYNKQNDGVILLAISGGTTPYTLLWSTGASTPSISNLAPNVYFCNITDGNDCKYVFQDTVKEPEPIVVGFDTTNISCYGLTDGMLTAVPTGGNGGYTYIWHIDSTTQTITGLAEGTYSVTVTDSKSCLGNGSAPISEPDTLYISGTQVTHLTCNEDSTGMVELTISGGTLPLSFAWSNGDTLLDLSSVLGGAYNVTITDDMGCTDTSSFFILEPTAINVSDTVITDETCAGQNSGSINITVEGGVSPYVFDWSNSESTEDISGISAGSYTLTVTDDSACYEMYEFEVLASSNIIVDTVIKANPSGLLNFDGSITVNASGGSTPYAYSINGGTAQSSNVFSGLAVDKYIVEIFDALSCSFETDTIELTSGVGIGNNYAGLVKVFPNPSSGLISVSISQKQLLNSVIGIYDTKGRLIYETKVENTLTEIDLSGFAKGMYMIKIHDTDFNEKLVIE